MKPKRKRIPNVPPAAEAPAPAMPTITLEKGQLEISRNAFVALTQTALPPATSVRVAAMSRHLQAADDCFREEILETYKRIGQFEEGQTEFKFETPEKEKEFNDALDELRTQEISVPGRKLSTFDFGTTYLQPQIIAPLDWLIDLE